MLNHNHILLCVELIFYELNQVVTSHHSGMMDMCIDFSRVIKVPMQNVSLLSSFVLLVMEFMEFEFFKQKLQPRLTERSHFFVENKLKASNEIVNKSVNFNEIIFVYSDLIFCLLFF